MIAVVPVRAGVLPAGADEAIAECGGRVLLAGSGTTDADLAAPATDVMAVELGDFAPGRWAAAIAAVLAGRDEDVVVLPASADGRDLAPRLAVELDRPLLAGATEIAADEVRLARRGGFDLVHVPLGGPVVATLQPGVRGVDASPVGAEVAVVDVDAAVADGDRADPVVVEVLPPDVATMDLAEAPRIVGGGAGLDGADRFGQLDRIATALGAATGATRVVTDRSWVPHERQIGTTGVVVDPELYVSFGISGAVQHTSGLGDPAHVISVNTDPHCPMMQMSDLAVVSDANEVLDELEALLAAATEPDGTEAADG